MKRIYLLKLSLLLASILVGTMNATSTDFVVDGIRYTTNYNGEVGVASYNNCSGDLVIPDTVQYGSKNYPVKFIGQNAFKNNINLTSINISNTVGSIGELAFEGCSNLYSITIGKSFFSIGYAAFSGCTSLKELIWNAKNFNTSTYYLPKEQIQMVTIGEGVLELPNNFLRGSKIETITIPESVQSIGDGAFSECYYLTELIWKARNCNSNGGMTTTSINNVSIGNKVISLPNNFVSLSKITSIVVPNSVTTIGSCAFKNCKYLADITIGSNVNTIASDAFSGCSGLTRMFWGAINCSKMGKMPESLEHVIISDGVTSLPDGFISRTKITAITIPNSVNIIGDSAFFYCRDLSNMIIPSSVNKIGCSTFQGCTGLSSVEISNSITSISVEAFSGCTGLSYVYIPNSVSKIGEKAFSGCTGLTNVSIPNSVTDIDNYAFLGCSSLISLSLPNSIQRVGWSVFKNCSALESVDLGNSITNINEYMFSDCICLRNITLPSSVITIGYGAFSNCKDLASIIIPKSVTSIGWSAFGGCNSLKEVIMLGLTPPTVSNSFVIGQLIYVPNIDSYQNNQGYGNYDIQGFYRSSSCITRVTVNSSNSNYFKLHLCKLKDSNGCILYTYNAQGDSIIISNLMPNSSNNVTIEVACNGEEYEIDDSFVTNSFSFKYKYSIGPTQTTYKKAYSVDRDDDYEFDAYGLDVRRGYNGDYLSYDDCGQVIETTNDSITIEYALSNLTPNTLYYYTPWIQYKGEKYTPFMGGGSFTTKPIDINCETITTPTSVYLVGEYSAGDALATDDYFTFNGEKFKTIYLTGLNPNTSYNYTYTIETLTGNQVTSDYFYTPSLSMVAQPARMLTNTTVMFEAQTNMIDEETMVGFEWRRYDAPDEMPSTKVYSPVFGGKIAGTLKNLAENVYYKYRPFYTSKSGKSYYGNWVAFLTADAGVVYEPIVYTYNSPAVTQTEATLQGVALRGSEDITERGFEYWKSGNGNVTKVTATGERMSKKVSGLQSGSKYIFRAFLTAGGETHYGNEVEFVTLSNSLDVNIDGEINIADINAVIDMILTDNQVSSGDVNGDGEVNIADINTIIDAILSN